MPWGGGREPRRPEEQEGPGGRGPAPSAPQNNRLLLLSPEKWGEVGRAHNTDIWIRSQFSGVNVLEGNFTGFSSGPLAPKMMRVTVFSIVPDG